MVADATTITTARCRDAIPQGEPLQRQCATRRDMQQAKERHAEGRFKDRDVGPLPGNGERASH